MYCIYIYIYICICVSIYIYIYIYVVQWPQSAGPTKDHLYSVTGGPSCKVIYLSLFSLFLSIYIYIYVYTYYYNCCYYYVYTMYKYLSPSLSLSLYIYIYVPLVRHYFGARGMRAPPLFRLLPESSSKFEVCSPHAECYFRKVHAKACAANKVMKQTKEIAHPMVTLLHS